MLRWEVQKIGSWVILRAWLDSMLFLCPAAAMRILPESNLVSSLRSPLVLASELQESCLDTSVSL